MGSELELSGHLTTLVDMTEYSQIPSTSKSNHELRIELPENLETTLSEMLCIYSVPPSLRQIKPSAYTPQVISIGPIHHDNELLKKMHVQKLRYFLDFCKRRTITEKQEDQERIQKEFATELLNQIDEDEIRHCYAFNSYNVTESTEFVNLILLDSVFIIELFLKSINFSAHQNDFIMGKPWLRTDIQKDLILLENQIPFSILEKIYNFAKKTIDDTPCNYPPFLALTCTYFHNFKPKKTNIGNPETILHFTDLVRHFWACKHPNMWPGTIDSLYNITKLHQAGLKLKPARGKCFLDINYCPGMSCLNLAELELPCFEVDDTTEFVVRNLMALEQCHYPDETYICNYIRLLDLLIDTAEDVDLLVDKKILVNGLGDGRAVAKLVNNLCNQIVEVKSCYTDLAIRLNGFYESCGNHTMATLRSVYFGDLWRGTGTIAAVALLVLTLIQTVGSIIQLKP